MDAYNINFPIYDHVKKTLLNLQNFDLYTIQESICCIYI